MILGVPTLNRYDLLGKLIVSAEAGTLKPSTYLIVDNGGRFGEEAPGMLGVTAALARGVVVYVLTPGKNLGVAASWNAILDRAGADPVTISNDDIELGTDALESLDTAIRECDFVHAGGWALFAQTVRCTEVVGPYDENFWPAYYEDSDYDRRLNLAKTDRRQIAVSLKHAQWATANADESGKIHESIPKNFEYFVQKWGGPPGCEAFEKPFNDSSAAESSPKQYEPRVWRKYT